MSNQIVIFKSCLRDKLTLIHILKFYILSAFSQRNIPSNSYSKNINRINRQISRGFFLLTFTNFDHSPDLLIKHRIASVELFNSKISLMKFQTDIRHWGTSENFKTFTSHLKIGQNKKTNFYNIDNESKTE